MPGARTKRRFVEEVPRLLRERNMSLRALEQEAELSHGFLSRVLRQRDYKTPSPELARRVARALDLPEEYFPEFREGAVIAAVKKDPRLRDELFDRVRHKG